MGITIGKATSGTRLHRAASDRTELTTAIKAATYRTAIHGDIGAVYEAVDDITTTKGITCQLDSIRRIVVQFWYIFVVRNCRF